MHDDDPAETLMHLLRNEWDPTNTHDITPRVHTGWYDYGAGGQQVTITNPREVPVNAGTGTTGWTAMGSGGRGVQLIAGEIDINTWPGTRDDTDVNPKALSSAMKNEVKRILADHDHGIINGEPVYNSLAPGPRRRFVDTEGPSAIYRWEVTAMYTYHDNRDN